MLLEGSCHCNAVGFSLESHTPYPYMRCYCSICRKTQGGGGYAINIMGRADTLQIRGKPNISVYRVKLESSGSGRLSSARRHFCGRCGSALWVSDPNWPDLVHPFASAIDTPLPKPPQTVHIFVGSAAPWVTIPQGIKDVNFAEYPDLAIIDWHRAHHLVTD